MPKTATVSLRDLLGRDVMSSLARLLAGPRPAPRFVDQQEPVHEAPPAEDPDLEPFVDWDARIGRGPGFFRSDADECASRRVDLRGPTDLDPGPLPMEEAPDDTLEEAQFLHF
ncbi:MAG: hypothetical protein R3F59_22930 [Myxococcota bacterium]